MEGNATYGYYVPNNIEAPELSQGFLFRVRKYLFSLFANSFYRQTTASRIIRY